MAPSSRLPPALSSRDFSVFLAGALVSNTGTRMTTVVMAYQIYQLTNAPLDIGLLGLARGIPQILLSLFGGVLADARDRRQLMMRMQLITFAVSASLAGLTATGRMASWMLVGASVLYALTSALQAPSQQAVIPNLVPEEHTRSAVALYNVQRQIAQVVGPSLAGLALAAAGPAWGYGLDAASWLAICAALAVIHRPLQGASKAATSWEAVVEGARFVWSRQVILAFMVLDFGAQFFGSAQALLPIYARDILHAGPLALGFLYAALPAGSLVAALTLSTAAHVERAGRWVLLGVALYASASIGFGLSNQLWLSIACLALAGLGSTVGSVLRGTTNQLLTPDHLRGRVAAINSIFTGGGPQLGQFESGVVAQVWGTQVSAVTGGMGALATVGLIALLPRVRHFTFPTAGDSTTTVRPVSPERART
jgi:MFS family permease